MDGGYLIENGLNNNLMINVIDKGTNWDGAGRLPMIELDGVRWYVDKRLLQMRTAAKMGEEIVFEDVDEITMGLLLDEIRNS